MRTLTAIALCLLLASTTATAQHTWQPPAGHQQISIWPATPPDAIATPGAEHTTWDPPQKGIAGKGVTGITNVTQPTITVYQRQ